MCLYEPALEDHQDEMKALHKSDAEIRKSTNRTQTSWILKDSVGTFGIRVHTLWLQADVIWTDFQGVYWLNDNFYT